MALDEKLVGKAVAVLTKNKLSPNAPISRALDALFDASPFMDMDEDEVEAYARAAMPQVSAPPPLTPLRGSNNRQHGGSQHGAGGAPKRQASSRRNLDDPSIIKAPYRFAELEDNVAMPEKDVGSHCSPLRDGLSATIHVEWVAETPLLIGQSEASRSADGKESDPVLPMTLLGDKDYIIPGASLRGMLRSAMEITAFARIGAVDRHIRYGLRDFDHPAYTDRSKVTKLPEVRAGWLRVGNMDDPTSWTITSIGKHWAHVPVESNGLGNGNGKGWAALDLKQKYGYLNMIPDQGSGIIDFTVTTLFGANEKDKQGREVCRPVAGNGRKGVVVVSGKLPGGGNKKYDYVFFDQAENGARVPLNGDVVALFQRLYSKPAKNRLEPDGTWKDLVPTLNIGKSIPVFYVGDLEAQGKDFFFGLTRLFKVPHERTIGDVINKQSAHADISPTRAELAAYKYEPDFVENLFGYVTEPRKEGASKEPAARAPISSIARKSRIAFSFARLKQGVAPALSEPIDVILSAPRASYAPFYLRSKGDIDYSALDNETDGLKVAGRKRYVPRYAPGTPARKVIDEIRAIGRAQINLITKPGAAVNYKVVSKLKFLIPQGTQELAFTSEIRLHNVTPAELGAVLYALTHGGDPAKPGRHMLGRARAFGAGQIRVNSARLTVEMNCNGGALTDSAPQGEEIVSANGMKGFCPAPTAKAASLSHKPYLDAFRALMTQKIGKDWEQSASIQQFMALSRPGVIPASQLAYMPLADFKPVRDAVKPLRGAIEGKPGAPRQGLGENGRLLTVPMKV